MGDPKKAPPKELTFYRYANAATIGDYVESQFVDNIVKDPGKGCYLFRDEETANYYTDVMTDGKRSEIYGDLIADDGDWVDTYGRKGYLCTDGWKRVMEDTLTPKHKYPATYQLTACYMQRWKCPDGIDVPASFRKCAGIYKMVFELYGHDQKTIAL